MENLLNIDSILIGLYLISLLTIWYFTSKKQSTDDYLIWERKLWSMSTLATINASKTWSIIMVFTAMVYTWWFSAMWYFIWMTIWFLIFIPFALRLKDISNNRFYTLSDYFKHQYWKISSYFASALSIFFMLWFLIINLIAITKILVLFLWFPFWISSIIIMGIILIYLLMWWFKAVVNTDMVQYIAMIIIMIILWYILFDSWSVLEYDWSLFKADIWSILWFFIIWLLFPFAMPELWQRVYSAKDKASLKKWMIWSAAIYVLFSLMIGLVALITKYHFPDIDPDLALIHWFKNLLSPWFIWLSLILLFSAIMSTIDTYIFTWSSLIVQDFFDLNKEGTVKMMKKVIIWFTLLALIISILIQDLIVWSYIFASLVVVLAIWWLSTWINEDIKEKTVISWFIFWIFWVLVFLIFSMMNWNITPTIVLIWLISSTVWILVWWIYSKYWDKKKW